MKYKIIAGTQTHKTDDLDTMLMVAARYDRQKVGHTVELWHDQKLIKRVEYTYGS